MGEIYKAASQVVVWVGKESPSDRNGVKLLDLLLEKFGFPDYVEDLVMDISFSLETYGLPAKDDPQWTDLLGIFKRSWFIRVWTVQEFLYARKSHVRIGGIVLSWNQAVIAAINANRYSELGAIMYRPNGARQQLEQLWRLWVVKVTIGPFVFAGTKPMTRQLSFTNVFRRLLTPPITYQSFVDYLWKPSPKPDLNTLLYALNGREATNLQDRVFSVISLAQDGRVDKIDYQKGLDEIFVDAVQMTSGMEEGSWIIPPNGNLAFLLSIEVPSNIPGVPSWAPDYILHRFFDCMEETRTSKRKLPVGTLDGSLDATKRVSILRLSVPHLTNHQ